MVISSLFILVCLQYESHFWTTLPSLSKEGLPLEFAQPFLVNIRIFPVKLTMSTIPALPNLNHAAIPRFPEGAAVLRLDMDCSEFLLDLACPIC
jgi:hypothetical protein